ncbi:MULTISPECIES: ferredoxin [Staphylococcus]|uniref:ferredoxin n=1 Tax=Staphylococcus TaxID=1279 RepID=UPI001C839A18|nr:MULTISPECIES: ferredoxin [Staphylococcus]MBX5320027.1 ferredoxin [Staphylococcus caprae]MCR6087314.1 ferredoxin [Staphylococcus aureus]
MNYYTYVDRENCISCAACGVAAPNLFKYDVEDIVYGCLDNNCGCEPVPFNEIEHLKNACEGCPTESIKISQHPFNKKEV